MGISLISDSDGGPLFSSPAPAYYIRSQESDIPVESFIDGAIVTLTIEVTYCTPAASKCEYKFSELWRPPNPWPDEPGTAPAEGANPDSLSAVETGVDTIKLAAKRYQSLTPKFRTVINRLLRSENPFSGSYRDGVQFSGCPVSWCYDPLASGYRLSVWIYVPKTAGIFKGKLLLGLLKNPLHKHAPALSIQFSRKLFPSWEGMMALLASIFLCPTSDLRLRRLDICAHLQRDLHHLRLRLCVQKRRLPRKLKAHWEDGFYLSLQGSNQNYERYAVYVKIHKIGDHYKIRIEARFQGLKLARLFPGVDAKNIHLGDLPTMLTQCKNFFPGIQWLEPTRFADVERRRKVKKGWAQAAIECLRKKHPRASKVWRIVRRHSNRLQRRLTRIAFADIRRFFGAGRPCSAVRQVLATAFTPAWVSQPELNFVGAPVELEITRPNPAALGLGTYRAHGPPVRGIRARRGAGAATDPTSGVWLEINLGIAKGI